MKICFLWVERFRNFKDFGFNISSSLKFNYDRESNFLSVKKADSLPVDFFGESITDVIGIIGKNGSGKSNAVELVCKLLKGGRTSIKSDFLIVYENSGDIICEYSFWGDHKLKSNYNITFKKYEDNINPLKVVFFSNVFDERINEFSREVSDISVNYRFRKSSSFSRRKELTDFEKQIRFTVSKIFPRLGIELPTHLQITSKVWANKLNSTGYHQLYGDRLFKTISDFKTKFRSRVRDIRPDNKFIYILRYSFFFEKIHEFLKKVRQTNSYSYAIHDLDNFLLGMLSEVRTEDITEAMLSYIEDKFNNILEISALNDEEEEKIQKRVGAQISFLRKLKNTTLYFDYENEGFGNRNFEYFSFRFDPSDSNTFIQKYVNLFEELNLLEINWAGISSGHRAYLNLFASLYQELRFTKHENLLLCIDEGDLYLHPKWQVEFFSKLISTLRSIFNGKIQLVLTSHSPFLLSDLPKQSITILDNSYANLSFDGIELKRNTFGGNLYDLYAEPFFLGDNRTSDFAHQIILETINEVENNKLNKSDKNRIQRIVDILGDEVIQYRINKLLAND
jgi:predicted ATPase